MLRDINIRKTNYTKYEVTVILRKKNGEILRKHITRNNIDVLIEIIKKLWRLETLDNDVERVDIDKYTNKIIITKKIKK